MFFLIFLLTHCASVKQSDLKNNYKSLNSLLLNSGDPDSRPFLKAHMKNGNVILITQNWKIDTNVYAIHGYGRVYNIDRVLVQEDYIEIPIDSIALFETNRIDAAVKDQYTSRAIIIGLINVAASIYCITNPKACYGSCPTFYINDVGNLHYSNGEGFSSAILPSLEYGDIDDLGYYYSKSKEIDLTMKNEAFETHYVNDISIFAYPLKEGEQVFHSIDDTYISTMNVYPLSQAFLKSDNITKYLKYPDHNELISLADSLNLSSKEEIILEFKNISNKNKLGLVLSYRQSLMSTFLFYSTLSYMGDEAGDYFSKLIKDNSVYKKIQDQISEELGGIDVYSYNSENHEWIKQGIFFETGPIAFNKQILALKNIPNNSNNTIKIKLKVNKGYWKIDYTGLAVIDREIIPNYVHPESMMKNGVEDNIELPKLKDNKSYLVSMPADKWIFKFKLPDCESNKYELFLYSKGYYIEWLRSEWFKDKDIAKLKMLYLNTKKYLKSVAPEFKEFEKTMEKEFWNSRIDKMRISNNEK